MFSNHGHGAVNQKSIIKMQLKIQIFQRLGNTFLNNPWVKEELKITTRKHFAWDGNENIALEAVKDTLLLAIVALLMED